MTFPPVPRPAAASTQWMSTKAPLGLLFVGITLLLAPLSTIAAEVSGSSSPGLTIDLATPLISDSIVITDSLTIADARVAIDITHTFVGDLAVALDSDAGGISVLLSDESGEGLPGMQVSFASTGLSFNVDQLQAGLGVRMLAQGPGSMADFHGDASDDTWTITIEDTFPDSDDGVLSGWEVVLSDTPVGPNPPPVNDDCVGALTITSASGASFDTTGATDSGVSTCGSGVNPDVWFVYEAVGNDLVTFSLCGSAYDTVLSVHDGSNGCPVDPTSELGCNDDADCGAGFATQSEVEIVVSAGSTYYLSVGGFDGASGLGSLLVSESPAPAVTFERGDANADGQFDIADTIFLLDFLFPIGTVNPPTCDDSADVNDDGNIDIADAVRTLDSLFAIGAPVPIPAPAGQCGLDPTADLLDCETFLPCSP